ncbi:class I SAM-dependent methyltransferase [Flavobacterium sp. ZT3R25]|uniref:class I SAM-dependent methyltransferase n=1 Tax=Flavobacterium galactosi TaxID=3398735 RepID=UPI003A8B3754
MKKKIKNLLSYSPYNLYETVRNKMNQAKKNKKEISKINFYLENNEIKKIQIGCGTNFLEGWLNTDIKNNDKIIYLDAGEKFPLESDSFDFVYSEHLFEHLKTGQQLNMLTESFRILKKGGVMRIATPNISFLFRLFENPNTPEMIDYVNWAVKNIPHLFEANNMVVDQEEHYVYVINNFFKAWGHQVIHNISSLSKLALQCNFAQVRECTVGESNVLDLKNIERHGTIIPERINFLETMVVELVKL